MAFQDHGIHSFKECVPEGSDYFQKDSGKSTHMKNSTLEEPLIYLSIWIRNDAIMNEEDDKAEGSRRSLPTKQIKISIQLSLHDIVLLCS